ncbi:MAG: DNA-binding transcriptional ArsR family regulator [Myxococcota bacterium]|jgi:DNA-binding transcriptional ArsR family regulator
MTPQPSDDPGPIFSALADPTRRGFVARLARGPATVGQLAAPLPISLPAVSRHVRVLERAGLVTRSRRGRHQVLTLRPEALDAAQRFLADTYTFWEGTLDRLADYLEDGDD